MKNVAVIYLENSPGQVAGDRAADAQRATAIAWAQANGYDLGGIYSDAGISAERPMRSAAQVAVDVVCATPGNALIVFSVGHLCSWDELRSIAARLERAGCEFVSISEGVDTSAPRVGDFFFRFMRGREVAA